MWTGVQHDKAYVVPLAHDIEVDSSRSGPGRTVPLLQMRFGGLLGVVGTTKNVKRSDDPP